MAKTTKTAEPSEPAPPFVAIKIKAADVAKPPKGTFLSPLNLGVLYYRQTADAKPIALRVGDWLLTYPDGSLQHATQRDWISQYAPLLDESVESRPRGVLISGPGRDSE